jgi:hypothetical protein
MDSLVLYLGLFRKWVGELTGFDPQDHSEWLCKSIVMLGYSCSDVSVWIIVAVTVERYIVVCHPLKANMVRRPVFLFYLFDYFNSAYSRIILM